MPLFRDLDGNHYDLPRELLQAHVVTGELPEDARLHGEEVQAAAGASPAPEYRWERASGDTERRDARAAAYNWPRPPVYNYGESSAAAGEGDARAAAYNWPRPPVYNYGESSAAAGEGDARAAAYNWPRPPVYNYTCGEAPAEAAQGMESYNYVPDPSYRYGDEVTPDAAYNYPEPAYNYAQGPRGAAYDEAAKDAAPARR